MCTTCKEKKKRQTKKTDTDIVCVPLQRKGENRPRKMILHNNK